MCLRLFLLLALTPLLEIWVLTEIGTRIGALPTFALLVVTAVIGAAIARWQGLEKAREIQRQMQLRQMPAAELLDGLMILIAGLLLLIPGIVSDVMGLGLLIPPIRRLVLRYVGAVIKGKLVVRVQSFGTSFSATMSTRSDESDLPPNVIDAEFERRPLEQPRLTLQPPESDLPPS